MRHSALVLAMLPLAAPRWCQVENVKADVKGDYSFTGAWRLDSCTTLQLDHGKCAEHDCPYRVKFGDEEIIELADALHGNSVLTALSLSANKLTDESVKALAEALRENEALTELNLQANDIGDGGALALAEVLEQNPTFTVLNLQQNNIGDAGGRALLEVLKSNTSALETLHLGGNKMVSDLAALAQEVTERNRLPPPAHGDEL